MPPIRESLKSVKTRSTKEQKIRTERRVRDLLQSRQRLQDLKFLTTAKRRTDLLVGEQEDLGTRLQRQIVLLILFVVASALECYCWLFARCVFYCY